MNLKAELYKELENDPFGLLNARPKQSTHRDEVKMIIENFQNILEFYEKNEREPDKNAQRPERTLALRLQGIREDTNQIAILREFDRFNLLQNSEINIDNITDFNDDPFGLLSGDDDIFTLKHVSKEKDTPDYVAKRKVCKDFGNYEQLFKSCHNDLLKKKRTLQDYRGERFIKEGLFFVLKGVVGYVASIGKMKREKNKSNARLHCIFENGIESDMLLRSLSAELYKDGKIVSQLNEEIEDGLNQISKDDILSGYIYILKSKSDDEIIRNIENLYKIGYSSISVEERIKNAKKLEKLLHQFFGNSCLNIKIVGNDGEYHTPREWFIAPIKVIKQAILMLENEEIIYYKYDEETQEVIHNLLFSNNLI
ncbi:MAG: hypothetical protein COB17_08645 [Sulfurimonas sp.]|nr:MAG: hypothetical protein COB17_08645 [Sulfurimonas sp.]